MTRVNPSNGQDADKDLSTSGREVYDLLVAYAKQETTEPLKGLGRYIGFGAAGSLLVALGSILIILGVLRVLQTETSTTFTGNWSWAPYLLTLVVAGGLIGLAIAAINSASTPGEKAARQRKNADRKDA